MQAALAWKKKPIHAFGQDKNPFIFGEQMMMAQDRFQTFPTTLRPLAQLTVLGLETEHYACRAASSGGRPNLQSSRLSSFSLMVMLEPSFLLLTER